jgi:hypothetical protein
MNLAYAYAVDESVLQVFAACKGRDRSELLRIFEQLSNNPFQQGDFTQKTASLRELQVKRLGKWLVTYWPDHGACELRIVDVRRLVP